MLVERSVLKSYYFLNQSYPLWWNKLYIIKKIIKKKTIIYPCISYIFFCHWRVWISKIRLICIGLLSKINSLRKYRSTTCHKFLNVDHHPNKLFHDQQWKMSHKWRVSQERKVCEPLLIVKIRLDKSSTDRYEIMNPTTVT